MTATKAVALVSSASQANPGNNFKNLADDTGLIVFGLLTPQDLASAARVCRSWARLLENNRPLWQAFASRLTVPLPQEPSPTAFAATSLSCFWRGVCEAEWCRSAQIKKGICSLETLQTGKYAPTILNLGADGKLYTAGVNNTAGVNLRDHTWSVKVWSAVEAGWKCEPCVEGNADNHQQMIKVSCVGSDGKIYTGSEDGTVKIWGKNTAGFWSCETTLREHTGAIRCLELGPDGKIYTGSDDGTAKIWNKTIQGVWVCKETLTIYKLCPADGIISLQIGVD